MCISKLFFYDSFMKLIKITFILLNCIFLNGCFQSTALLGSGVTVAKTGNIIQAGLQYSVNKAIKSETGKNTIEHFNDIVNNKK